MGEDCTRVVPHDGGHPRTRGGVTRGQSRAAFGCLITSLFYLFLFLDYFLLSSLYPHAYTFSETDIWTIRKGFSYV